MKKLFAFQVCALAWGLLSATAHAQGNTCQQVQVETLSPLNFGTVFFSRLVPGQVVFHPSEHLEVLSAGTSLPTAPSHSPGRVRVKGPAKSLVYFSVTNPVTRNIQVEQIKLVNATTLRELEKQGDLWVLPTKNLPETELTVVGTLNFQGLTQRQNFITTFTVDCTFVQPE